MHFFKTAVRPPHFKGVIFREKLMEKMQKNRAMIRQSKAQNMVFEK